MSANSKDDGVNGFPVPFEHAIEFGDNSEANCDNYSTDLIRGILLVSIHFSAIIRICYVVIVRLALSLTAVNVASIG